MSDISPVLQLVDGKPVVMSTVVADHFEKKHFHVMRDIKSIMAELPEEVCASNFGCTQVDVPMPAGGVRKLPAYLLSRDGFTLLAMGFTGKKALAWKVRYIQAFNAMEAELMQRTPRPEQTALPSASIDPSRQRELQNIIAAKVSMLPKEHHRQAYAEIYGRIKNKFRIAKYSQLPEAQYPIVVPYILEMELKTAQKALPTAQPAEEECPVDPEVLAKLRVDFREGVRNAKSSWREVMQKLVDVRCQFADATASVHRSDVSSSNDMAQRAFASVDLCLDIMTPFFDLMNEMLLIGREASIAQAEKRALAVQLWQMQRASNKPKRKMALSQ